MGKGKFNLGDYLRTDGVSELNTEQIVKIDLDRIDPDPNNFYSLEGIDELAANIELVGLLDALRVRPQDERFVVVSGHRRRAACMLIRDGGNPMFDAGVPCVVEYGEASDAMRELRLIYANSATRVMSSAEISKQAERVTELLYQLKEQGVEFPGRMREHVAQACQVSTSKLARLHAIRANLCEPMLGMFDKGRLNESVAYRISQEPPETQARIWKDQGDVLHNLTADGISSYLAHVRFLDSQKDAAADDRAVEDTGPYRDKFDAEAYIAQRREEDDFYGDMMCAVMDSIIDRLPLIDNRQDGIAALKKEFRWSSTGGMTVNYEGRGNGLELESRRRGIEPILRSWTEAFDVLCVEAINRLGKMNANKRPAVDSGGPSRAPAPTWQTGTPPRKGRYFCQVDMGDSKPHENRCYWGDDGWSCYGSNLKANGWKVVGWWPLPEEVLI